MSLSESESQSSWDEAHPERPIYIIFQNIPQLLWSKTVSCVATQNQGNPVFTGEEKKVKNANKFGKEQHPICFWHHLLFFLIENKIWLIWDRPL